MVENGRETGGRRRESDRMCEGVGCEVKGGSRAARGQV